MNKNSKMRKINGAFLKPLCYTDKKERRAAYVSAFGRPAAAHHPG